MGSEALDEGVLTRYDLRRHHRRLLPDVYGPRHGSPTLRDRTTAAWLWSKREGIVSGLAASAALGAKWVDVDAPIELISSNHRPPRGVVTRADTLFDGEVVDRFGLPVTSADRTAFDLARRGPVGQAVARLDALARATHFTVEDVQAVGLRHPNARGVRRLDHVLDLVDPGAESPRETWLRLLLIDGGFPRPQTQIPVLGPDGYPRYFLDMGWPEVMISVEYDGDGHRERPRFKNDIIRSEYLAHVGWIHLRVVAGDTRSEILYRVNRAWNSPRR